MRSVWRQFGWLWVGEKVRRRCAGLSGFCVVTLYKVLEGLREGQDDINPGRSNATRRTLRRDRFGFARFRLPLERVDRNFALGKVGHEAPLAAHRFPEAAQGADVQGRSGLPTGQVEY